MINQYSVAFGGVELVGVAPHIDGQWTVEKVAGLSPGEYRRQTIVVPGRPGARALGASFQQVKLVEIEASVGAASPEDAEDAADELTAAWEPSGVDEWLIVRMAGGERALLGRPVSCTLVYDLLSASHVAARCEFEATDPLWHSVDVHSVTVTANTAAGSGGYAVPAAVPWGSSSAGISPSDVVIVNAGNAATGWQVTLTGPLTTPSLLLDGVALVFDAEVPVGAVVVVDSRDQSVTFGGASRPTWHRIGTPWWSISPGRHFFGLRAVAGTGSAVLEWRYAWH